ncbi:Uncharacterized protein SCF082_LOCUS22203 [Durusdinium trenchii]|uniref:DNA ligase (ATP) n=1 Tax=Durusdinium trenchii TaxID=1381693 RepID=A0ABP0LEC5_9DINO
MSSFDSLEDSQSALLDAPEDCGAVEHSGPVCSKCEAPMATDQMVCRSCGWYPSLGIMVEVDADWERVASPEAGPAPPKRSPMEEFFSAIPSWTWPLVGTNLLILAACVAGRLLLPASSVAFEFWGVWQLVVGLAMVVVLHVLCFVMTASSDTSIGLFDIIVSPLKAWFKTFNKLPERKWLVIGATNGVMLALTAALVVGGINWDRLWDWNIKAHTKTSLVDAITSAAGNGPVEGDLEESIEDFTGKAGQVDGAKGGKGKASTDKQREVVRKNADCLIVGFELNDLDKLSKLYMAHEVNGRLYYAGNLTPNLEPEEAAKLKAGLMRSRTGTPLVKTGHVATWVKPRFPVRVSYTVQSTDGKLRDMQIEELLPEINLPW